MEGLCLYQVSQTAPCRANTALQIPTPAPCRVRAPFIYTKSKIVVSLDSLTNLLHSWKYDMKSTLNSFTFVSYTNTACLCQTNLTGVYIMTYFSVQSPNVFFEPQQDKLCFAMWSTCFVPPSFSWLDMSAASVSHVARASGHVVRTFSHVDVTSAF